MHSFNKVFSSLLLLLYLFLVPIPAVASTEESGHWVDTPRKKMPFKVGFEFQESSGLCPWAEDNVLFQKKPLFYMCDAGLNLSLWHVVIDTNDIEFVTPPFTDAQERYLEISIDTILTALAILQQLLDHTGQVTFEVWTEKIQEGLKGTSHDLQYDPAYYPPIKGYPMIKPNAHWKPMFSPQATFQHPLEYAIPLYFSLFGFDSEYMPAFSASLPFRDLFLDAQAKADAPEFRRWVEAYCGQKMNGLFFLHALTFVQMSPLEDPTDLRHQEPRVEEDEETVATRIIPESVDYDNDTLSQTPPHSFTNNPDPPEDATHRALQQNIDHLDTQALETSYKRLIQTSQVDPKAHLTLMSRRPFSSMFRDIHTTGTYVEYFLSAMKYNLGFISVARLFNRTDYGEQFFDAQTGKAKSLLEFLPCFRETFREKNKETLIKLLKQGVLTTTMLRNFKENITIEGFPVTQLMDHYFKSALQSIDTPQNTFIVDIHHMKLLNIPFSFDALSPPWFTSMENSMGRFRLDMSAEDQTYGEAIVEVRGIYDVKPWFLKKCGLENDRPGLFLRKPDHNLKLQVSKLFQFLSHFGKETDITEIFYLGMPFALRKY